MADLRAIEEQKRFWDAATGAGAAAPGGLDPALTEAAGRLRALDRVPPPDPVFVARLRDELTTAAARPLPRVAGRPGGRDGRVELPRRAGLPPWTAVPGLPRRALAQAATAALPVVTVLAAYVAFGPGPTFGLQIPNLRGGQVAGLRNAGSDPVVMFELSVVSVAEPT